MATTTSSENMFPSSSSATSSISAGTAGGESSENNIGAMSNPGTRAQSDVLNRVVQGAHQTIDRLAESAAPHIQRLEQGVTSASDTLHTRADQARELGDEWTETLRTTVRENPLASVAAAVAIGLLLAKLTS